MQKVTRREFLRECGRIAAAIGVSPLFGPTIASALEGVAAGDPPVLWLQGQACSGCSISLSYSSHPSLSSVIADIVSLRFHPTFSVAQGGAATDQIANTVKSGEYVLVAEGAVPVGVPSACEVGERDYAGLVREATLGAKFVMAIGTCASFGGIPAADPNPTGALGLGDFLKREGISKRVVNVPGCPAHYEWFISTLSHLLLFGIPDLDEHDRPLMFFGPDKKVHENCERFQHFVQDAYAQDFSEGGCLFRLGCRGPITYADCPTRHWNGNVNWCVKSGSPCIGCSRPDFPGGKDRPFYLVLEELKNLAMEGSGDGHTKYKA
ncbi:MAG: hydrogenase small subunit [bacterium]